MTRTLTVLVTVLWTGAVQAATFYISPTGSDSNSGASTAAPWLTWPHALANTACGDTLIARNGTYTTAKNGTPIITKVCTASKIYTIRAENERRAHLASNGTSYALRTFEAAYITIEGLRFSMVDRQGSGFSTVSIRSSSHITLRRALAVGNNRYYNTHAVLLYHTDDSLVEESEAHHFHRHGFIIAHGDRNVFRRNYCNPHMRPDISGGYASATPTSGEDCFIVYPGSDNVIENNIAEGFMLKGYAAEATNPGSERNEFLGNIDMGALSGLQLDARKGTGAHLMPKDHVVRDHVSVNSARIGMYFRANKNTKVFNASVLGNGSGSIRGIVADHSSSTPGDGVSSVFFNNTLVFDMGSTGFTVTGQSSDNGTNVDAFSNGTNYASNYPWTSKFTTDPQMGSCKVWRPDGSAAKANNWGADILYRYVDGALTKTPLWDPSTGKFPHGAIIAGVNDTPGASVADVHKRLNVNAGGCAFPAGYSDSKPTQAPGIQMPGHNTSTGTGTISDSVVVASATDHLLAFVALRDGGGNVGTITGVSSSCGGGEAFTFGARGRTHDGSGAIHDVEGWYLSNPSAGDCTISVTTSGTVGSWAMDVMGSTDGTGTPVWAANGSHGLLVSTSAVAVPTNNGETLYAATSGSSGVAVSTGANQTLLTDTIIEPMRLAVSSQSGNDGDVMDFAFGGNTYAAIVAVSIPPDGSDGNSEGGGSDTSTDTYVHYLFDETSGEQALDSSGNGLDGTLVGGVSRVLFREGGGVYFANDTTDRHVDIPFGMGVDPTAQSLTACLWVLPDAAAIPNQKIVLSTPNGSSQRFYLGWYQGYWGIGVQGSGFESMSEFPVMPQWTHVCLRANADTDTATLSIDGVTGTTTDKSVKPYTSYTLADNLRIGNGTYDINFGGHAADELKFWKRALSDAEIRTEYEQVDVATKFASPDNSNDGACSEITACVDNDGCCPEDCLGNDLDCTVTGTVSCTDDGQGGKTCAVTDIGCSAMADSMLPMVMLCHGLGVLSLIRRRRRGRNAKS